MNHPANAEDLTDAEKKHIPVISSSDSVKPGEPFEVSVTVGSIPHVMEPAHHIQWIELYANEEILGKVSLTPGFTKATTTLTVVMETTGIITLKAIERCNVHGLWENTKRIIAG
ncbi:MAG: class II SORL domain-containing protein [Methanosarcinales archaeon]|nr:class II SORL domain-containing protein [Methanosarcinales archaeon]